MNISSGCSCRPCGFASGALRKSQSLKMNPGVVSAPGIPSKLTTIAFSAGYSRPPPITESVEASPAMYQFQAPKQQTNLSATITQVTVFVGKVPPGLDDDVLRSILALCGNLSSWRRVTDPATSKPKAFGFADYTNPLGVIRAVKLLNDFEVAGGKLLVKVDEKTQKVLDRFTNELNRAEGEIQVAERERLDKEEQEIRKAIKTEDELQKKIEAEEKEERERELERDERRKKRDFKIYLDKERVWESRERERQDARERANRTTRDDEERSAMVARDVSFDNDDEDYYRSKHAKDNHGKARRERELNWDIRDRAAALEEIEREKKKIAEEKRKAEEAILEQQRKLKEEAEAREAAEKAERDRLSKDLERVRAQQALKPTVEKKRKVAEQVIGFNPNEDADAAAQYRPAKQRLTSLDIEIQKERDIQLALEKAKRIVSQIPKTKEEIFARPLNWELLEQNGVLNTKIREWASGKVKKYLGEEEPELVQFILSKLHEHLQPEQVLTELRAVLDTDADGFLLECWRRLIFEEMQLLEK